jgi:GNAT superfamily N-acetyltransferase
MLDVVSPEKIKRHSRIAPEGVQFRMAVVEDVPALVELGREQFETSVYSAYGIEYCPYAAEKYLAMVIEHMFLPHIIAELDGKIIGGISFSYDSSFSKKPIAILQNLFVTKKYRRTLIGRMLVDAACDVAKDEQACCFFAPVNNGGEHINSLGNLLMKADFKLSGYIMTRRL